MVAAVSRIDYREVRTRSQNLPEKKFDSDKRENNAKLLSFVVLKFYLNTVFCTYD